MKRAPAAITTASETRESDAASDTVRLTGRRSVNRTAASAISTRKIVASPAIPHRKSVSFFAMFAAVATASPGTTRLERTIVASG